MRTADPTVHYRRVDRPGGARDKRRSVDRAANIPRLIVPGLRDSGATHWQTHWHKGMPGSRRLRQDDWETPDLDRWAAAVAREIDALRAPPLVIAHSFGCLAAIHAATHHGRAIAGALLVAPADPDRFALGTQLTQQSLSFPTMLVASSNDPGLKLITAAYMAIRWGARFIGYTGAGHIDAESGFGPWHEGRVLLANLQADATRRAHKPTAPHATNA